MQFNDLKTNLTSMFPKEKGETADHYQFFIKESMDILRDHNDYDRAWEEVKGYDGNTRRPRFSFFKNIVFTTKSSGMDVFKYYKCNCGTLLGEKSNGGCPICHSPTAEMRFSKEAKKILWCQSSCFDCSIYSEFAIGTSCKEYGTRGYETCKARGQCKCVSCCRFEFLRAYHPDRLRAGTEMAIKALPIPLSEPGKAFQDGRATIADINGFLNTKLSAKANKRFREATS